MRYLIGFLRFWYDFIIGDDWIMAAGISVALMLTVALVHYGITAWWLLPFAATLLLTASLWRAH